MKQRHLVSMCAAMLIVISPIAAYAEPTHHHPDLIQLERLDRGLVAATTPQGVFLSWRLLGNEVSGHTGTGMAGPSFHVYRDDQRIATVTDSTNYLDTASVPGARYRVVAVGNGAGSHSGAKVSPWPADNYDLPLRKPADA